MKRTINLEKDLDILIVKLKKYTKFKYNRRQQCFREFLDDHTLDALGDDLKLSILKLNKSKRVDTKGIFNYFKKAWKNHILKIIDKNLNTQKRGSIYHTSTQEAQTIAENLHKTFDKSELNELISLISNYYPKSTNLHTYTQLVLSGHTRKEITTIMKLTNENYLQIKQTFLDDIQKAYKDHYQSIQKDDSLTMEYFANTTKPTFTNLKRHKKINREDITYSIQYLKEIDYKLNAQFLVAHIIFYYKKTPYPKFKPVTVLLDNYKLEDNISITPETLAPYMDKLHSLSQEHIDTLITYTQSSEEVPTTSLHRILKDYKPKKQKITVNKKLKPLPSTNMKLKTQSSTNMKLKNPITKKMKSKSPPPKTLKPKASNSPKSNKGKP